MNRTLGLIFGIALLSGSVTAAPTAKSELEALNDKGKALATRSDASTQHARSALVSDYRAWAKKYGRKAVNHTIPISKMTKGSRVHVPGLGIPQADSWVIVPEGGGCPFLIEGDEMQCVLTHPPKDGQCQYFCTLIVKKGVPKDDPGKL